MKGLEKSLADRYSTVQELIDDIRRYVRHDVVSARKPTALYVFKRFAVRHRASLAAMTTVLASLVIALGVSIWGWVSTSAANQKAQEMTQHALAMKDRAEIVFSFFLAGVEKSKPKLEVPSNLQDMSIDKLLESYLDDIEKDLASQTPTLDPEVAIELLSRLGGVSYSRFETSHAVRSHEMLLPLLE
jgi:serine/threonine-protein kinase